ncbi:MAG: glutamyl-tRNA amidotransferase [Betaproteobacteria bacterium RIFCSPLOWO2_02_FULL_63_19]|nr:MAG: glutamyl-tRNA amidotransferase [Betaproteobacteria bacterium RIFCSPLOWO2_02_FULL_63_19]
MPPDSPTTLRGRIEEDMKSALKAKQTQRLSAIRLLLAAIKQKEIDERIELTDADVLGIVEKQIKQRRDSIAQYGAANRQDLVDAESFELNVLESYMPEQLSQTQVAEEITRVLAETGANALADMGKAMALLKTRLAGRADMGKVSGLVRARLSR